MVSWKGLAFIAALVAQVSAYQGNSLYERDYDSIYARDAEAEAFDDDSWGVYAREAEPEADYDDDLDLSFLSRREAIVKNNKQSTPGAGSKYRQPAHNPYFSTDRAMNFAAD